MRIINKKTILALLAVILLLSQFAMVPVHAEEVTEVIDGLKWTVNDSNVLTKVEADTNQITGEITIPASVNGREVKIIGAANGGASLFNGKSITKVTISEGITEIANGSSVSDSIFGNCIDLTSVSFPNSLKTIGNYAFRGCAALAQVYFGDELKILGSYVFYGCAKLNDVTLPDNLTSLGNYAFYNCASLTTINIPAGIITIPSNVFRGCTSLETVTFALHEVVKIDNYAFSGCTNLKNIVLPNSIKQIGEYAFQNCTSLQNINFPVSLSSEGMESADYSIGSYAFIGSGLVSINFPDVPMRLGLSVFSGCTKLTYVKLSGDGSVYAYYTGSSSTYANTNSVFYNCGNLETIALQEGATEVFNFAFASSAIKSIIIPNTVTKVKDYAFYYASSLTSVTFPEHLESIGNYAFYYASSLVSVTFPYGIESIGNYAFSYATNLTSLTLPDSVKSIGSNAFSYATNLTSLTLPDSVESIGSNAFYSSALTSFTFPDNEKFVTISNNLLTNTKIGSIKIPDRITEIGTSAFANTQLTEITIPKNVKKIGGNFVYGCKLLEKINWDTDSVEITGDIRFTDCAKLTKVEFPNPTGTPTIYGYTSSSSNYKTYNAFRGCPLLKEITIPACVTQVKHFAFVDSSLEKITFLSKNTTILNDNAINTLKIGGANPATFYIPRGSSGSNSLETRIVTGTASNKYNYKYTDTVVSATAQDGSAIVFTKNISEGGTGGLNVSFDSASKYGFKKSAHTGELTALDVLAAAHEAKYEWTGGTPGDQLVIDETGAIKKAFDAGVSSYGFSVNGVEKTIAEIGNTIVEAGDRVHFFPKAEGGTYFKLSVKGEEYKQEINLIPDYNHTLVLTDSDGNPVTERFIPIYALNLETGELSDEAIGYINENGEATVTFTENGTYALVAWDANSQSFILNFLVVNVDAPNNKIGVTEVTGSPAFTTEVPLSSGYTAGTFVQITPDGFGDAVFNPRHSEYNLYVNLDTTGVNFTVEAEDSSTSPLLSVSVNEAETLTDESASSGKWTPAITLDGAETKVVLSVKTEYNSITFVRPYTINVIKEGMTPSAGILDVSGHEKTYYYDGEYKPGASSLTLLVHKDQAEAKLEVTVTSGTELYVGETKEAGVKQDVLSSAGDRAVYLAKFDLSGLTYSTSHNSETARKLITYRDDEGVKTTKEFTVNFKLRSPNDGVFTPDKLIEYNPAAGQFVGLSNANNVLIGYTLYAKYLSLGEFGGYATYRYDEPIRNDPKNPFGVDFIVYGNTYQGGMVNEPASVQVSYDGETWYYLAGQLHYELETVRLSDVPLLAGTTESLRVWNGSGYPKDADWGYADIATCSPELYAETNWSVGAEPYNPYRQGAIAAYKKDGSGGNLGDMFDLSWIVDADGVPVKLDEVLRDGIRYIKLQNVVDVPTNGPFGSISPEIGTITRVNPAQVKAQPVGITSAPEVFTINNVDILDILTPIGRNTYYLKGFDLNKMDVNVKIVGASKDDNIYVNTEAYYGGEANYTGLCDAYGNRAVRVVIQNGECEPLIYVVGCVEGGKPEDNADLESITMFPDEVKLSFEGNRYTGISKYDSMALTVSARNPKAAVTIEGSGIEEALSLTDGNEHNTGAITLVPGINRYKVTVVSESTNVTETYDVAVIREVQPSGGSGGYKLPEIEVVPENGGGSGDGGGSGGGAVSVAIRDELLDEINKKIEDTFSYEKSIVLTPAYEIKVDLPNSSPDSGASVSVGWLASELENLITDLKENTENDPDTDKNEAAIAQAVAETLEALREEGAIAIDSKGNIVTNTDYLLSKMTTAQKTAIDTGAIVRLEAVPTDQIEPPVDGEGGNKIFGPWMPFDNPKLSNVKVGEICVAKLQNDLQRVRFLEYGDSFPALKGGFFVITDEDFVVKAPEASLVPTDMLFYSVTDNSFLDRCEDDDGVVSDPEPIITVWENNAAATGAGGSGSGGGGCDAGFGAGAAVFALALAFCLRKRGTKK
jgi:hypothetical protein